MSYTYSEPALADDRTCWTLFILDPDGDIVVDLQSEPCDAESREVKREALIEKAEGLLSHLNR